MDATLVAALAEAVGEGNLWSAPLAATLDPGWHPHNLGADVAVAPPDTAAVAAVLRLCNAARVGVVTQGGRTGLAGAAASGAGQLVLLTRRLDRLLELDARAGVAVVEAGVTLERLQQAAGEHGLSPGIDLAARGSATLGGMIATNAGGIEAFRNGVMRHRVLGLEVVLADGRVLCDLKRVTKANEGYDLKQLFVGAEGTLGVITRAVLALEPAVSGHATALVACASAERAVALFARLRAAAGDRLRAVEAMWRDYALVSGRETGAGALMRFLEGPGEVFVIVGTAGGEEQLGTWLAEAAEAGEVLDAVVAGSGRERDAIWKVREDSWSIDRAFPGGLWFDVSVPLALLDDYVGGLRARVAGVDPRLRVFAMGHLGDGNLHLTITRGEPAAHLADPVSAAVYHGLAEAGGSFSAEHGIGLEKRASLAFYGAPEKLAVMRALKEVLDPNGIMNPGKVLSP